MRRQALLISLGLLALPAAGWAQNAPSADQIIKSLTPTATTPTTRGIRIAPGGSVGSTSSSASQPPSAAPAVSLTVQFATGSADLTPQAMQVLDNLGRALTDRTLTAYRFRIEGHTDTVGTREYNKELSDRRAAAVVDYLASKFNVDRSRIEAIGMGEDGLLIQTPDQTSEPRNRRVQVVNIGS